MGAALQDSISQVSKVGRFHQWPNGCMVLKKGSLKRGYGWKKTCHKTWVIYELVFIWHDHQRQNWLNRLQIISSFANQSHECTLLQRQQNNYWHYKLEKQQIDNWQLTVVIISKRGRDNLLWKEGIFVCRSLWSCNFRHCIFTAAT